MTFSTDSTIVAQATASGQAALAVLRLSGSRAWELATTLFKGSPLKAREVSYGHFIDPFINIATKPTASPVLVDEVLLLPFKAPKSFTGEDVVEIHCHGNPYTTQRLIALCVQAGAILATPGEFTRRAFVNGRLSLTQAEAVLDLIEAESSAMSEMACLQLKKGQLSHHINQLRERIVTVQATIVASVDYPEEVDEPERTTLQKELTLLEQQAESLLSASQHNRVVREGFKVALLGQPNAGKSSLFNALLNSNRAIVSSQAGTTRDVLTETLHLEGLAVTLMDTAGLRESTETIEQLGIERSWHSATEADAILFLSPAKGLNLKQAGQWPGEEEALLQQLPQGIPCLKLATQCDLLNTGMHSDAEPHPLFVEGATEGFRQDVTYLSVVTGLGLPNVFTWLKRVIAQHRKATLTQHQGLAVSLNQRQSACLQTMVRHVQAAKAAVKTPGLPLDVVTVPLTDALLELDALEGRDTREEVLDSVFNRFCVGK